MKRLAHTTAILLLTGLSYAQADDRHHPQPGQQEAAANPAATAAPPSTGMGMGMMDMNRMQEMHKAMERIQQSQDPAERKRLMHEHMEQMQKMMTGMHGMMGKGMGGGMSVEDRQQMMEKRMDMMQGMMEQMMGHMMAAEGEKPVRGKAEGADDKPEHQPPAN